MIRESELELVESAYLALLRLPLGSIARTRVRPALANMRDLIAGAHDLPSEDVQNEFQLRANNI